MASAKRARSTPKSKPTAVKTAAKRKQLKHKNANLRATLDAQTHLLYDTLKQDKISAPPTTAPVQSSVNELTMVLTHSTL